MNEILKCKECKKYTLEKTCSCGGAAITVEPPKFKPADPYSHLRRKAKEEDRKKSGLL